MVGQNDAVKSCDNTPADETSSDFTLLSIWLSSIMVMTVHFNI